MSRHAVDLHQIRRLPIRLGNRSGMLEPNCPTPFSFQSFGDVRTTEEVVNDLLRPGTAKAAAE